MPLPVIADVIRCSVEGILPNGQQWANVLHARKSGILTNAGAIAILDPLLAAFWTDHTVANPGWAYYASTGASIQRIRYTPLDGVTPTTVVSHVQAGITAGDALPAQVALAVTLYTAHRGRRYRGRFFLGGFGEARSDGTGHALSTMTPDFVLEFNAVRTGLVGTGVTMVVASYGKPDAANPGGWAPFATDITSVAVNNKFDTIRRRSRT